jgi:hypothetical protein
MKIAARVVFSILYLLTSGCAGRTVFSVEVLKTPTPSAIDLTAPAASAALHTPTFTPDAPLPTAASIPVDLPADFSPVLYGQKFDGNTFFTLLGAVQGETWLTPDQTAPYLRGETDYDVYSLLGGPYRVHGSIPEFSPASRNYSIRTESTLQEKGMIGLVPGWPVLKRNVQELSPDQEVYRQVVLDWLQTQGLNSPQLGVGNIYRLDLEGDGVDEIFISATHLDESQRTTRTGDYSIILMRRVAGNEAVTVFIDGDVYHSSELEVTYPRTYSLGNFLDLDGDGVLEAVVEFHAWEDVGALLYHIDGQTIEKVP